MKILLRYYWFAGGVLEYDTDSGCVLSNINKNWKNWGDPEISTGCIWKQNGKTFALYGKESNRIFQYGSSKWNITEKVNTVLNNFVFLRNFKIIRNGITEFNIWYKPSNIALGFIDPTYDLIDAEGDDFFLSIHNSFKFESKNNQ